jgi:hypothetical protein
VCPMVVRLGNLAAPLSGGRLTRAGWSGCSDAPNAMGKMTKWRGDHWSAHLGPQMARRAAVVDRGGGSASLGSDDGGSSTWGSSGSKKMMRSFAAVSSSSSRLQLRRAAVNRWHTTAAMVWFLRIEIWGK